MKKNNFLNIIQIIYDHVLLFSWSKYEKNMQQLLTDTHCVRKLMMMLSTNVGCIIYYSTIKTQKT